MLEENVAVMAKKNYYYQKILQKLQKKEEKVALDTLIKDEDALLLQQGAGIEDAEKRKSHSDEVRNLEAHADELETILKNANDWIHVFQQEKQYIVAQQDEVIQFLCRAIHDAAVEMARNGRGGELQEPGGSKNGGASDLQIAKLAKETTKMDDFAALVPPLIALDELSPEENRFVLQFLLEKMKIYQERISLLFQNNRQVSPFGAPGGKHRDLISKQLGVELPPIGNSSSAQIPPGGAMANGGSSSPMSPLKQKRRMFAHVTSSVAVAMEGGEPAGTNQSNPDPPMQTRKPGVSAAAAGQHSLPSNSLLAMVTNQFNFLSTATVSAGKSPLKSQSQYQSSPNTKNSNSHTRAVPSGSPAKQGGVQKVQPPGNASVFAKKAHGHAGSALAVSTDSILDATGLLQSQSMLTAWSSSSIPTLADVGAAILE